jgi:hypothetical protein
MVLTVHDAINRGNNLFIVVFLAVLAAGLVGEIFTETEWIDRLDDITVIVIAIITVCWYLYGNNRYTRAYLPFVLLILAFFTKLGGLYIEAGDPAAVGDELGILPTMFFLIIIAGYILWKTDRSGGDLPEKTEGSV